MGGLQAKSMTSQRNRATYKMVDMRYYGNVMTTTRWRQYVTMEITKKKDYKVDKQVQLTNVILKI